MEFPELGMRCQHAGCSQLDFLPFHCSACSGAFCLEHRLPYQHNCKACSGSQAPFIDLKVIVCPICAKAVRVAEGEDPDIEWGKHASSSQCDPSNYDRVYKKARCMAEKCKEKLTLTNKFECRDCGAVVCLKHRFGDSHGCKERQLRVEQLRKRARMTLSGRLGFRNKRAAAGNKRLPARESDSKSSCSIM